MNAAATPRGAAPEGFPTMMIDACIWGWAGKTEERPAIEPDAQRRGSARLDRNRLLRDIPGQWRVTPHRPATIGHPHPIAVARRTA